MKMISNKTILHLKAALYADGDEAIENFLGFKVPENWDEEEIDEAIENVIDQMPEDTLQDFIDQYKADNFVSVKIVNRNVLSIMVTNDFREALMKAINEICNFVSDKKLQKFFDENEFNISFRNLYMTFTEGNFHERKIQTNDGKFAFTVSTDDFIHCFCDYGGYQFDYFVKSPEVQ